jgi:hypothetical protein
MAWKSLKHLNKVLSLHFEFNFTLILLITLNFPCHLFLTALQRIWDS